MGEHATCMRKDDTHNREDASRVWEHATSNREDAICNREVAF